MGCIKNIPKKPQKLKTRATGAIGHRSAKVTHLNGNLQKWHIKDMKQALLHHFTQQRSDYNGPVMGYKKIAETYNIPPETFCRHLSGSHKGYYGYLAGGKDQSCMFTPKQEHELAEHIGKFAQAGFPFTPKEIQELAFEYAHLNSIPGFNEMRKTAGYKWLRVFLKCKKQLIIKMPKLLSIYRTKCTNKEVVSHWFELYKEVLEKNSIGGPLYIWNVDECGCVNNPKAKKVVVIIRRRATQMSASEKGETSTALFFCECSRHVDQTISHSQRPESAAGLEK